VIVVPGAAPERTFAGGLWSETINVAWPLARLELSCWGIRFGASVRVLGWLIPRLDVSYEELTGAQLISAPAASRGVCLYIASATGPIVFLSRRGTGILDHLQVHGVQVDRSVTRLPWGANLHHP
jgi:hypothetical protein